MERKELHEELYRSIFKRKSFHRFRDIGDSKISPEEINGIYEFWKKVEPLHEEIRTEIQIVPAEETNCRRGEEYCVLIYSETKDGYLQNAGYMGEKLDLYLVSKNIGTLWFGIGRVPEKIRNGLSFVIMIALAKVDSEGKFRRDMYKSKRKPAEEIWKGAALEGITGIVRFAPSACNTQPWLTEYDGKLRIYRYKKPGIRGMMPVNLVAFYNRIDVGIYLCFLELCLEHNRIGFHRETFTDPGDNRELTLNAVYEIHSLEE